VLKMSLSADAGEGRSGLAAVRDAGGGPGIARGYTEEGFRGPRQSGAAAIIRWRSSSWTRRTLGNRALLQRYSRRCVFVGERMRERHRAGWGGPRFGSPLSEAGRFHAVMPAQKTRALPREEVGALCGATISLPIRAWVYCHRVGGKWARAQGSASCAVSRLPATVWRGRKGEMRGRLRPAAFRGGRRRLLVALWRASYCLLALAETYNPGSFLVSPLAPGVDAPSAAIFSSAPIEACTSAAESGRPFLVASSGLGLPIGGTEGYADWDGHSALLLSGANGDPPAAGAGIGLMLLGAHSARRGCLIVHPPRGG